MKTKNVKTIAASCIGLFLVACTPKPATSYTLTGNVEGLPDGVHVQLRPVSHDNEKPLADTTVTNGRFVFKGVADEPRAVWLIVKDAYGNAPLMLENGDIRIAGQVTATDCNGTPQYNLDNLSVTGSPLTLKYRQLMSVRDSLDVIYTANNEKYKTVRAAYGEAFRNKDRARMDSIAATSEYKQSAQADSAFFVAVEKAYYKVVMDHKDSFWGPLMMVSLFSYLTEEQKPWYDALSQDAKASYYGRKVIEEIHPTGKVGSKAPEFTAKTREGKDVTLKELSEGKKYILIDFWASWCNPCRKEIPNLKEIYAQYASKGLEIVSISIDKKEAEWLKALEEEQLPWPNFRDIDTIADTYKVKFVPTMYLIDGQGMVVAENLRGQALADKVKDLFN